MNVDDAKQFLPILKVCKSDIELTSYCGNSIECVGYVLVKVKIADSLVPLKLYIVNSDRKPLCGREWLNELNWTGTQCLIKTRQ